MKKTNKKVAISVIVPCYNVEQYVRKSISCLMEQTYQNIEVIVIDDASTDHTYEILQELQKKYGEKLKLYQNEKNGGLAYTRNFGVKQATSKYIGFIDPDDYVDANYYEVLVNRLVEEEADLVVNDIQIVYEKEDRKIDVSKACIGEVTKENLIDNGLCASACNKLLRKDLLLKYPFLEGKVNEDVASIIPIIVYSQKIAYTSEAVYYYLQRKNSIQNSEFTVRRFDMFDSIHTCLERIKEDEKYEIYKELILLHQLLELYIYIIIEIEEKEKREEIISSFIEKLSTFDFQLYRLRCLKTFIKRHRKAFRLYYSVVIRLLKYKNAKMINSVIWLKKESRTFLKKIMGKNKEIGDYTLKGIEKLAKKQSKKKEEIKVSVVVPNYNYEKFLIRRIYSILAQDTKIHELILLDDCSKDHSRKLIDEIVACIQDKVTVRKIYNETNSGSAFKQWAKGMKEATGDYVWIAEADDYCDKKMLSSLLVPIKKDQEVVISYVDTAFTDKKGNIFLPSIKPEIDIMKTGHWNQDYIHDGKEEIQQYTFLNNTIANVSSCIIKKDDYSEIYEEAGSYKQSGDWIFYVSIMAKGKIAYVDKVMNFYRVHDTQITSNMDKQKHLAEILKVYHFITEKFGTNDWQAEKRKERYDFLKRVWGVEGESNEENSDNIH